MSGIPAIRLLACATFAVMAVSCAKPEASAAAKPAGPAGVSTLDAAKLAEMIKAARGTVTVVNLWATWCPPCVAEMPEFARFYSDTKRSDVTFISVCANAPDTVKDEVKPFIEKNKLPFPVSVLSNADPEAIGKAAGADISGALPLTLIYDKTGKLQKQLEEPITFDSLTALVKPLL